MFNKYIHRLPKKLIRCVGALMVSLPIIIFVLPLLLTGGNISYGDADYQFQMYEAFRSSVLHYHQFPWWNPWISGGIPLFANPQFGPISITSLFVIPFGAILGIKISVLFYILIGFWGFYFISNRYFKNTNTRSLLISYIWAFSTFTVYRVIGGHDTFLLTQYFPWILYLYLTRKQSNKRWLYLGLILSLMIWSAPHYSVIMSFTFLFMIVLTKFVLEATSSIRRWGSKSKLNYLVLFEVKFWIKTLSLTVLLSFYRLYYVFHFVKDFPRPGANWPEPYFGAYKSFLSLFGPYQFGPKSPKPPIWSWMEASYAIGTFTFVVLIIIVLNIIINIKKNSSSKKILTSNQVAFTVLFIICLLLAQGKFSHFSPFSLLQKFPIFSSMRVAMRWLLGSSLACLLIITTYRIKKNSNIINLLLFLSVIQLFILGFNAFNNSFVIPPGKKISSNNVISQKNFWNTQPGSVNENLYSATINNIGQIRAGDALVDNRVSGSSDICDSARCNFVSKNAVLIYWSPNSIKLRRIAQGPITINMNPGSYWTINGNYPFRGYRVTEPLKKFNIYDNSEFITIKYVPKYSVEWLFNEL